MRVIETLHDLIEKAKLRTVYWALCIFAVSYFLTHTSKSMWMNIPISILFVSGLRILFGEVEFHWKVRKVGQQTYISHLEKKQLSVNDSRLSTKPPPPKWKRKVDSPIVEAAMEQFVNKLLQDFVTDLWYSRITSDKDAPELIRSIFMDVLGEISGRVKDINLVDLLTRDVVELVGDHLDIFRRNQATIGVDVMGTLSSEERDERLKHHLIASKELHPALISPACEYKVLQQLIGGLLDVVLRQREAQCPLVRCISRELVTCLVMQPIMNFASPGSMVMWPTRYPYFNVKMKDLNRYVNELIEYIFLATKDDRSKEGGHDKNSSLYNQETDLMVSRSDIQQAIPLDFSESLNSDLSNEEPTEPRPADWARLVEAATQRRTEILMPENLENMWAIGRNYKKKVQKISAGGLQAPVAKSSVINNAEPTTLSRKELFAQRPVTSSATEKPMVHTDTPVNDGKNNFVDLSRGVDKERCVGEAVIVHEDTGSLTLTVTSIGNKGGLKRSNSTSALKVQPDLENAFANQGGRSIISDFYKSDVGRHNDITDVGRFNDVRSVKNASDMLFGREGVHPPKLRCRVRGAYFEKLGTKSFAVYSIEVTDDKDNWFLKRRYSNFERLHRHLKDIPNYTIHLPPKRIFSSSTEDAFVHQRCIQLDKYLQDILSIANVAEQHEVWDFLSVSSKKYSFGRSSSAMRNLAVNVDDAVDDIVRQFKGVSDGLMKKVVGSYSPPHEASPEIIGRNLSLNGDEIITHHSWHKTTESSKIVSDREENGKDAIHGHEEVGLAVQSNGWHSDNDLGSKVFPPRVITRGEHFGSLDSEKKLGSEAESVSVNLGGCSAAGFPVTSDHLVDLVGVPPEWTPPKLTVPVLNLVDTMFQLKRRGWLRRQVFWISKQILQLMMEDAIDDWLLRQIQLLRRDDVIAQGIRWVQDVLWPDGTFFVRLNTRINMDDCQPNQQSFQTTSHHCKVSNPVSFEQQLETARRANDVKKMIFNGAPTALVSLIGRKPYRRCARDMYYFLQSTVCLKQLAYGVLELILVSVFPEVREVVLDVHEKKHTQPV